MLIITFYTYTYKCISTLNEANTNTHCYIYLFFSPSTMKTCNYFASSSCQFSKHAFMFMFMFMYTYNNNPHIRIYIYIYGVKCFYKRARQWLVEMTTMWKSILYHNITINCNNNVFLGIKKKIINKAGHATVFTIIIIIIITILLLLLLLFLVVCQTPITTIRCRWDLKKIHIHAISSDLLIRFFSSDVAFVIILFFFFTDCCIFFF